MYRVIVTTNRDRVEYIGFARKSISYNTEETHQTSFASWNMTMTAYAAVINDLKGSIFGLNYSVVVEFLNADDNWSYHHHALHLEIEDLSRM